MQSHDHETCLPVAGHLRQFLRGIAIHDQRFRTKPERYGRNQLAELVFGDRAAVGLDPREMEPGSGPDLRRLDHVNQNRGYADRFR